MPVYAYRAAGEAGCEQCRDGFETRQPVGAEPLRACPLCGAPIKRIIQSFGAGRSKSAFYQKAADCGFRTLRKQSDGSYGES